MKKDLVLVTFMLFAVMLLWTVTETIKKVFELTL
jgi:hypothetical protein|tara:strand:+ start:132 stop:233 length:102 start_codon:yes stop_codon:yes gene_type:complete